jgi:hypothetical protein
MSSIVEQTFPYIKKIPDEKGELVLYLSQSHPRATKTAFNSEIREMIKFNDYKQGDIRLYGIGILGKNKSIPIFEYRFAINNSNFGIIELDKLLKKYNKNLVKDDIIIYIPIYEENKFVGGIRIFVGGNLIYIGSQPVLKNLLSVTKEMESIVQEVYGKNIK